MLQGAVQVLETGEPQAMEGVQMWEAQALLVLMLLQTERPILVLAVGDQDSQAAMMEPQAQAAPA